MCRRGRPRTATRRDIAADAAIAAAFRDSPNTRTPEPVSRSYERGSRRQSPPRRVLQPPKMNSSTLRQSFCGARQKRLMGDFMVQQLVTQFPAGPKGGAVRTALDRLWGLLGLFGRGMLGRRTAAFSMAFIGPAAKMAKADGVAVCWERDAFERCSTCCPSIATASGVCTSWRPRTSAVTTSTRARSRLS